MYVQHKNEARSCNHSCSKKAKSPAYYECVCSLRYPACNVHPSYCHLWPVQLSIFFQTISTA